MPPPAPYISPNENVCLICRKITGPKVFYRCKTKYHVLCNICCKQHLKKIFANHSTKLSATLVTLHEYSEFSVERIFGITPNSINSRIKKNKIYVEARRSKSQPALCKSIKCPHEACNKVISSMARHYEHDHPDISKFVTKKGQKWTFNSNISDIQFCTTFCVAKIELLCDEKAETTLNNANANSKALVPMLWLFISGLKYDAMYWLVSECNHTFLCTLEITSDIDTTGSAVLCEVNKIENVWADKSEGRLNGLCLPFGTISNMKGPCGELNLNVTIH